MALTIGPQKKPTTPLPAVEKAAPAVRTGQSESQTKESKSDKPNVPDTSATTAATSYQKAQQAAKQAFADPVAAPRLAGTSVTRPPGRGTQGNSLAPAMAGAALSVAAPGTSAARSVAGPEPLPAGQPDKAYDGALVGGDGKAYPPSTPLSQIPPALPSNGQEPKGTIIQVNGVGESIGKQGGSSIQQVADTTGYGVIGLHNATEGTLKDLLQSAGDKADLGNNKAVASLRELVYDKLKAGENLRLMGHSQGALVISRALHDVDQQLQKDGLSKGERESLLGKVQVDTLGGAASHFPDGPKYHHYINRTDPVPRAFGVKKGLFPWSESRKKAGKDAQFTYFTNWSTSIGENHKLGTYLDQWKG